MNTVNKEVVRVVIEGESVMAYHKMVETLKAENAHIRLTPSRFVACLVRRYHSLYFEKDRALIANEFFDSKEHLKEALRNARSPEELENALNLALERIKGGHGELHPAGKKRGRKPKTDANIIDEKQQNLIE